MQKSASSKMRSRMRVILICFMVLGFAVLIVQLFRLQIVQGEKFQADAATQQTRATILGAKRGTIYDRNGNTLAQSATVWNVCVSPADMEADKLDEVATGLAKILDVDKQSIIEKAGKKQTYYQRIKMRVDRTVYDEVLEYIIANNVKGIHFEEDTKRYYTYGSLASTVLGFTNYEGHGAYGLEAYYDKVLSGTPGIVVSAKNAKGSDMRLKYQQMYDAKDGNSVVLTLDEGIQHFLESNLEIAITEHSIGNRAAGIVMDVKTGAIVAMATKPDFDPNDPNTLQDPKALEKLEVYGQELKDATMGFREDSPEYKVAKETYNKQLQNLRYDQWRNKAISDTYEPGSVFKIITAATGLDNKAVSINDHFFCNGSIQVSGVTFNCWQHRGHGAEDFIMGMQNSCNPVFIAVGQRIGARLFYDYIENFGFDAVTGIDLPGEADSIRQSFDVLNKPGQVELSSISFGQTLKVTPLQMITAASAAINGGKLMKPYVVKQVLDSDGNVLETTQPVVKRQVISEETSATMRMLTEKVVDGGSGRFAAIPGYRIGGKTGTSEKLDKKPNTLNVLSFVGFAPMEDPQYAILVMLDEPKLDNVYGSVIAAPVVGAVFQEMLPYLGMEPNLTEEQRAQTDVEVPDLLYKAPHDAQAELTAKGLVTRIVGKGATVLRQIPQGHQKMPKGGQVILYTEEEIIQQDITVPNVLGMTAQQANVALVDAGLNVQLQGVTNNGVATIVGEQWPLPDAVAKTGDVVIITLARRPDDVPAAATEDQPVYLP